VKFCNAKGGSPANFAGNKRRETASFPVSFKFVSFAKGCDAMYRVFGALVLIAVASVLANSAGCNKSATPSGDVLVLESEQIDLVQGGEKQVKVKTGKADTIDMVLTDFGLTVKSNGDTVTVIAAKDAKEGMHPVVVKGGKAKDAILKVNVKKDGK
jgi:hypothetical protein